MKMVFTRKFEAAHRLLSDKSPKCNAPHGHSFQVKVTIEATKPKLLDNDVNMVEEFGAAKKLWHTWIDEYVDHSMMFNEKDPLYDAVVMLVPHARVLLTPGDPTTEMVCATFMAKCNAFLKAEHGNALRCTRIEVVETATNTVVFDGNAHDHISAFWGHWWNRADMSTHDLDEVDDLEPEPEEDVDFEFSESSRINQVLVAIGSNVMYKFPVVTGLGVSADVSGFPLIQIYLRNDVPTRARQEITDYIRREGALADLPILFEVIGEMEAL